MSKKLLLIGLVCFGSVCFAQTTADTINQDTSVRITISKVATFRGGEDSLKRYIANEVKCPSLALENDVKGAVTVIFVIDKDGNVKNTATLGTKIGSGLEEEAIRVIKSTSGMWEPGEVDGKKVSVRFKIPITFHLYSTPKKRRFFKRK